MTGVQSCLVWFLYGKHAHIHGILITLKECQTNTFWSKTSHFLPFSGSFSAPNNRSPAGQVSRCFSRSCSNFPRPSWAKCSPLGRPLRCIRPTIHPLDFYVCMTCGRRPFATLGGNLGIYFGIRRSNHNTMNTQENHCNTAQFDPLLTVEAHHIAHLPLCQKEGQGCLRRAWGTALCGSRANVKELS